MTALGYLLVALLFSVIGSGVLYLRSRQPTSMESGIDEFRRGMDALRPEKESSRSSDDGGPSAG